MTYSGAEVVVLDGTTGVATVPGLVANAPFDLVDSCLCDKVEDCSRVERSRALLFWSSWPDD